MYSKAFSEIADHTIEQQYLSSTDCEFKISPSSSSTSGVTLIFRNFQTEQDEDFLTVRNNGINQSKKFPANFLNFLIEVTSDMHIVEFSAIINTTFVHHFLVHACGNTTW